MPGSESLYMKEIYMQVVGYYTRFKIIFITTYIITEMALSNKTC